MRVFRRYCTCLLTIFGSGDMSDFSGAKTVTIGKNSTVSTTISSLTKGRTYYVRLRICKQNSSGTKYYSAWSSKKYLKITR